MEMKTARRNFLRRTKPTSAPETTEASSTNTETTTNKFTRRGNSKFKTRKQLEKNVEKNEIEKFENSSQRPSLNGGVRRFERPPATRKFISRRRLGGANSSTVPVSASTSTVSSTTLRTNRVISRRRQSTTSTTPETTTSVATTQPTTKLDEDEESLQDIGDTDAIEDPSLESRQPKSSFKSQRRPLILKDTTSDQNPSATNEEESKRQSKKYSASIQQMQLEDLVKKSQEETSAEGQTTVEDISPETALAIAAHQLITAPVPVVTDTDDDIKTTKIAQTTDGYTHNSRESKEDRTPVYGDNQSTARNEQTQIDFEPTKVSDTTRYDYDGSTVTTPVYKPTDYIQTTASGSYAVDIDSPKISTYDVPKLTNFPNTGTTQDFSVTTGYSEFDSPKIIYTKSPATNSETNTATSQPFTTANGNLYTNGGDLDSTLLGYLPKSDYQSESVTNNYIRSSTYPETSTKYVSRNSPSFVPNFSTTYTNRVSPDDTVLEELSRSRVSTTLSPLQTSRQDFERKTATLAANYQRIPSAFTARATEAAVTSGYAFVQRGTNRFRNEKLLPLNDAGYSTVGYTRARQEPSQFTREYLLESPVTKTYDDEYRYLSPITTPIPVPAVPRRVIRKKLQRKISTTQRPTTPPPSPTSSVQPRRASPRPFEKASKTQQKGRRPISSYDYYDDSAEKVAMKYVEGTKVVLHDSGNIECLDIGNFPHPLSCKKFISCARIDNGSLLGWEYICPKGLSFDPVGGICNWSAGLGCNEKDH